MQTAPPQRRVGVASVQPLASADGSTVYSSQQQQDLNWDYLLHHDQNSEDSASEEGDILTEEDEEDDTEEVEDEFEEPVAFEVKTGRSKELSSKSKVDIINSCIEHYTKIWYPGNHADEDYDQAFNPRGLWHEFQSLPKEEQERLVEETKIRIEEAGYKLDKLCDKIGESCWTSEQAIRRQCASLQITVDNLQQERWELKIYTQESEPPSLDLDLDNNVAAPQQQSHDSPIRLVDRSSGANITQNLQNEYIEVPLSATPMSIDLTFDSDDDMPAPPDLSTKPAIQSTTRGTFRRRGHSHPFQSQTPRTIHASVELPQPSQSSPPSSLTASPVSQLPSLQTIRNWTWSSLLLKRDRKRILQKTLSELPASDLSTLRTRLGSVRKPNLLREIPECIAMYLRSDTSIPGVLPRDVAKITSFTNLFLCWWFARRLYQYVGGGVEIERAKLEELAAILKAGCRDLEVWYDWLVFVMRETFAEAKVEEGGMGWGSQAEIVVIDD